MRKRTVKKPERDRLIFEVLRAIRGKTASEVGRKSAVSPQTIRNWRRVGRDATRYPHAVTLAAVGEAAGMELRFVRSNRLTNRLEE